MFLSLFSGRQRADAGGDRSAFGSFWFEPLGVRTASGQRVTAQSAMRLSAVYASVRVVAESIAVLPFRMYLRNDKDGSRRAVTDHWLVRLMARPNDWQTPFEWREMMQAHLCLRGNAFNQIVGDGQGGIRALLPIHPDAVTVQPLKSGGFNYRVKLADGTETVLDRSIVWHVRGLATDGFVGLNPMEMAAEVMGVGLAGQGYAARFFQNDARPAGWIEYDGNFKDNQQKLTFRDGWQKAQGGANRGKTAVLEKGFKYHETSVNNADAQFLEMMKMTRSEIAGIFRVPPHKIGDMEGATFSTIEQQSIDFINDCLQPWSERWESSIETHLLLDSDIGKYDIEFDFAALLRGDMQARTAYYTGNILNGSLTRNEARILEGRAPLKGLDEPLKPVNMQDASAPPPPPGTPPAPSPPAPQPVPSPKPRKDASVDAEDGRLQALACAAAERLARREAKELGAIIEVVPVDAEALAAWSQKYPGIVATSFGVTEQAARDYMESRNADEIRRGQVEQDIYSAALPKLQALALKGTL